jgi:iron-sulfur cluster repair protein YtfE (RIC family)
MLVQLGARAPDDVAGVLLACHERIRKFLGIARQLAVVAATGAVREPDIAAAAEQVRRYFAEALPLHVADEDETIAPRLAGAPAAAAALAAIHRDHAAHAPAIAVLVEICGAIARDPARAAATSGDLARVAAWLTDELEAHLALEERTVIPAVRRLPREAQDVIRAEIRARRERAAAV